MAEMRENAICPNPSRQGIFDSLLFLRSHFLIKSVIYRIDDLIFSTSLILDSLEPKMEMGQKLLSQDFEVVG